MVMGIEEISWVPTCDGSRRVRKSGEDRMESARSQGRADARAADLEESAAAVVGTRHRRRRRMTGVLEVLVWWAALTGCRR
ncbi:hypothetical protein GCM10009548_31350 [Streptomyces malaysiensis subsp. malaysiensis]